jgi:hypothetical protein
MMIHAQDEAQAVLERTVFNRDVGKVSFVESSGVTWADAAESIITKLRKAGAKRGQVLSIDAHTTPECAATFSAHFSSQMKDQGPLDAQFIKLSGAPVPEPAGEDGWSALCQNTARAAQTVGSCQDIISITGSLENGAPAYFVFYYPRTGLTPRR